MTDPRALHEQELVKAIPHLRAFARTFCSDPARADDLVQETLIKAWKNLHSFQTGTNFKAWLFTILRNAYFSEFRKRKREVDDPDETHTKSLAVSPEKPLRSGAHQPSSPLLSASAAVARQYAPPSPYVGNQRSPSVRAQEPPLAAGGVATSPVSPLPRSTTPTSLGAVSARSCLTTTAQSRLIRTSEIVRPRPAVIVTASPSRASSTRVSPASPRASHSAPLT